MINFDPTVNFGQIAVGVSFIVTIVTVFANTQSSLKHLSSRIDTMESNTKEWRNKIDKELEQQTLILVAIGKQDQRMNDHERRMDDLLKRMDAQQTVAIAMSQRREPPG